MTEVPGNSPAPGWYEDPEQPTMLRWWDGGRWTNDIRPMDNTQATGPGNNQSGVRPVGDWLTETFRLLVNNAGSIFTLIVVLVLPGSLLSSLGVWTTLRDVVITFATEGDQLEFDVDGFNDPLLLGLSLGANFFFTLLFNVAVVRLALANRFEPLADWSTSLRSAVGRFPAVLGWTLVGLALFVAVAVVVIVGIAIFATISPILGVLMGIVLVVLIPLFLFARYSMIFSSPMAGAKGARSPMEVHRIGRGRTMAMLGRCLLLALVAFVANLAGSAITGPISSAGGTQPFDPELQVIRFVDLVGTNMGLFMLLQLVVAIVGAIAVLIWHVGMTVMFEDLGGKLDPEIRETASTAA